MYHLPFYRQIQQYKESGVTIGDSTMGGWYGAAVEKLKLLYDILRQHILQSEYIQIDESVIPVKVLPNSKLGGAIEYTYPLLPRLSRYVNDGRINIDNNLPYRERH